MTCSPDHAEIFKSHFLMLKDVVSFFVFILFLLLSNPSVACGYAYAPEEKIPDILRDAVYIGKVKVLKEGSEGTFLMAVQPYGNYKEQEIFSFIATHSSCDKGAVPVGTIYEEIILSYGGIKGSYVRASQPELLREEVWVGLRDLAQETEKWNALSLECKNQNGRWEIQKNGFVNEYNCVTH